MEAYYISAIMVLAAFLYSWVITFLVFGETIEVVTGDGPETAARNRDFCYECLGS
jgi:hypothetical protein